MKLVNTSVKRPVGVIMIVLAIIALGVVSAKNLAIDLFPKIDFPIAVVATTYQDAASIDVENLISRPVESAVSSIEGIETVRTQSQPGSSLVIMMFKNGVDLDQSLLDVREKLDQVKSFLPEQAGDPSVIRFSPDQLPVMWISLTGKDAQTLTQIADDQLVPFFERQDGVASVSIEGGKKREIQLQLNEASMYQYGVTPQMIIQALNGSNYAGSVGKIEKGQQDLQLRLTGEFTSLADIKQTIILTEIGTEIHVEDVAEVTDTFKAQNALTLVNGKPSVVLSIMKKTDANTVNVAKAIQGGMDEITGKLPADAKLDVVLDTSKFIQTSVDSVVNNILIGGAISVFILLLFLKSVRATLVIALSIPIAVISTFTLMYFTGETLNVLTLGGLALGLGMMVDSSIVILENIYAYRKRGYSLFDAATKGASELAPAVIASTTTTLVVFLPIVYVDGIASDMFTPLALTVSFSLIASLVVAITIVPMLSSKLLSKAMEDSGRRYWFDVFLDKVNKMYTRLLRVVLKFRKTMISITLLLIGGSIALVPLIGTEFIPAADQGQIEIKAETIQGSSFSYTATVVEKINNVLADYKEDIQTNYVTVGGGSFGPTDTSTNKATYTIQLVPSNKRDKTTTMILKEMEKDLEQIPGIEFKVSAMEGGIGTGAPIEIELNGPENEVLREIAKEVIADISNIKGVLNPTSSVEDAVPQMSIKVNEAKAAAYGLNEEQIGNQIQMYFTGQNATIYREAGQEMDVRLVYPRDKTKTIANLENMQISTPAGVSIPLEAVAKWEETEGPVKLLRQNQQAQIDVTTEVLDRDLGSVAKDIEVRLAELNLPEGYSYTMGGQAADMQEAFGDLALALIFSIFLVYAVMAIQFENFLYPFIIMFSLPTVVIGILGGLFITGLPMSIPGFIGIIMLAGIVVNNAIILVDYINILRRSGLDREAAILQAGPSRLRPILMTTLTTVLAMIPLALALGEGDELQQPLAVTIIFGLTISTIFTLLLIPVVYTLFDDLSQKFNRKQKREV